MRNIQPIHISKVGRENVATQTWIPISDSLRVVRDARAGEANMCERARRDVGPHLGLNQAKSCGLDRGGRGIIP